MGQKRNWAGNFTMTLKHYHFASEAHQDVNMKRLRLQFRLEQGQRYDNA